MPPDRPSPAPRFYSSRPTLPCSTPDARVLTPPPTTSPGTLRPSSRAGPPVIPSSSSSHPERSEGSGGGVVAHRSPSAPAQTKSRGTKRRRDSSGACGAFGMTGWRCGAFGWTSRRGGVFRVTQPAPRRATCGGVPRRDTSGPPPVPVRLSQGGAVDCRLPCPLCPGRRSGRSQDPCRRRSPSIGGRPAARMRRRASSTSYATRNRVRRRASESYWA